MSTCSADGDEDEVKIEKYMESVRLEPAQWLAGITFARNTIQEGCEGNDIKSGTSLP